MITLSRFGRNLCKFMKFELSLAHHFNLHWSSSLNTFEEPVFPPKSFGPSMPHDSCILIKTSVYWQSILFNQLDHQKFLPKAHQPVLFSKCAVVLSCRYTQILRHNPFTLDLQQVLLSVVAKASRFPSISSCLIPIPSRKPDDFSLI
jgi:hypothetical protein